MIIKLIQICLLSIATLVFCTSIQAEKLRLVPTFENCSVYIEESENTSVKPRIQYREQGSSVWLDGHELTNSSNNPVFRGSIFGLKPSTDYEVRCIKLGEVVAIGTVKTWDEKVPIAKTIKLQDINAKGEPWLIEQGGTPDGWIKYVGSENYQINGGYEDTEAILLENVSYVILENIKITGGKRHGIQIKNSHHIRVINCDISGFGRIGKQDLSRGGKYYEPGQQKAINYDAGVYIDLGEQVVIERCFIHDPRNHANSWAYSHPAGATAIFVRAGEKGGLVVRHNDLIGSQKLRWNDVIEGYGNGKPHGGFRCDSDIYGNFLAFSNDDGIELDGGQCNVRFYGNKIEGTMCGISTATNAVGPSYVFNNLVTNLGDERGDARACVKNGGGSTYSKGTTYFYHNTFYTEGTGITGVGFGSDKNRAMFFGVSRNNILNVSSSAISDAYTPQQCNYDYDLAATPFGGKGNFNLKRPMESHGLAADPKFTSAENADFRLQPNSPAIGTGEKINGFSSFQKPEKIDLGAISSTSSGVLPWRPISITLDKYQLQLEAFGNTNTFPLSIVTIQAKELKKDTDFTILKNKAFPWLKVTPEQGTITANQNLKLQVSAKLDNLPPGRHPAAFIIKFDSGYSIPVTVYGTTAPIKINKQYNLTTLPGSENFKKVTFDGQEGLHFEKGIEKAVTIQTDMQIAGNYNLYFLVKCPKPFPLHDSLFLSINGGQEVKCAITPGADWHWVAFPGKTGTISLNKGQNTIKLSPREGIYIAKVLISSVPLLPYEFPISAK